MCTAYSRLTYLSKLAGSSSKSTPFLRLISLDCLLSDPMLAEKVHVITRQSIKSAVIFRFRTTSSKLLTYASLDAFAAGSMLSAQFLHPSHGVTYTMHSTYLQL